LNRRPIAWVVAVLVFSLSIRLLVYVSCDEPLVTFTIIGPFPIFPGIDAQFTIRVNNNGPKPMRLVNVTNWFSWDPQVSYHWRGSKIIENNSYVETSPLQLHIPENIAVDIDHILTTIADFIEPLDGSRYMITTVTAKTKLYVARPPIVVTKEVTKLFMTSVEVTKTVFTQPSSYSESLSIQIIGVIITIMLGGTGLLLGYHYWHTAREETRKSRIQEVEEKKLREAYAPLYELFRRAKFDDRIRSVVRQINPPREYVFEENEFLRAREIIETRGYHLGRREQMGLTVAMREFDVKEHTGIRYYRFRLVDVEPHWNHIYRTWLDLTKAAQVAD